MIKNLVHDPLILGRQSTPAAKAHKYIAANLLDTLSFYRVSCVGMAANMIGAHKRIIAFRDGEKHRIMYNPEIVSKAMPYDAEEGYLSLLGGPRPVTRYKAITVKFLDEKFTQQTEAFQDFTAQIIQHEIDHCNGILI